MKTAKELFNEIPFLDRKGDFFNIQKTIVIEKMEEYASEYKAALEKELERKSNDVSFHYATIEEEMRESLKNDISEMIYDAIPTGEVTAFDLIKVLKQLKTNVEKL